MNLRKVKVRMPQAQSGLEVKMRAGLGFNANQLSWPVMAGEFSEPDIEERQTLGPVDVDDANLEAELGETAVTDLSGDGIPEHYKIGGKRHYDGGTPLNLPDNSFIFSRDKSMKVKDKHILEQFGITNAPPSGLTPADIAKRFNINKYKKVLKEKESDDLAKKTAEMMIANYNLKLGKLALVQESMKGFPGGIPYISAAYLESVGIDPNDMLMRKQTEGEEQQPEGDVEPGEARYGGMPSYANGGGKQPTWDVSYFPTFKGYFFFQRDADGKVIEGTRTDKNPSGGTKTAEQIVNARKQKNTGNTPAQNTPAQQQATAARKNTPGAAAPKLPDSSKLVKPPLAKGDSTSDFDPRLGDYHEQYYTLVNKVNSDKNVQDNIYKNYRGRIQASKTLSDKDKERLLEAKQEDVIKNLLDYQKQNYIIKQYDDWNGNSILQDKIWDRTYGGLKNAKYKQVMGELGFKPEEVFDDDKTRIAQAAFAGLVDTSQDDQFKDYFKDYTATTGGPSQLTIYDKENPLLSDIDSIYGNNTASALFLARNPKKSEEVKEIDEDDNQLKKNVLPEEYKYDKETPFWLQDIIKTTGAFGDMARIKKYMPWMATPNVDYMDPEFMSPERELAANAENLAIGAQGIAQFTGPQAFNARFSQLSGQAAQNAADVLSRYNNANIGIANESEQFNVNVFNRYAEGRAANATSLFDKVTVANQQFDNSKNQARQEMRQSYIDAVTNRAQTDVLNTLYPQYAVDPLTGGTSVFRNPKQIKPVDEKSQIEQINAWMSKIPPNIEPNKWLDSFMKVQGFGSGKSKDDDDDTDFKNPGYTSTPKTSNKKS
jgi:hypothetical protein